MEFKNEIAYAPDDAWIWGNYSSFLLFSYGDVDGAIAKGQKAISIMDYGMGRFTLACALYTKWALLLQDGNKKKEAQQYFVRAWYLYPYPEKIIEKTSEYKYTRVTATELQKWLTQRSSGNGTHTPLEFGDSKSFDVIKVPKLKREISRFNDRYVSKVTV